MRITKIVQQQKRHDRYSVYIDEVFRFGLSEAALISSRIASGMEIDQPQLEAFIKLAEQDKLYGRTVRYVALRPRSEGEVRTYLRRLETAPELVDQMVDRMKQLNLLDDTSFASSWVENRRLLKSVSKRRLVQELKQKQVSDTIIERVLAEDTATDQDALTQLIVRKRRQTRYASDPTKLMQYLARQGFGYDDIKAAMAAAE